MYHIEQNKGVQEKKVTTHVYYYAQEDLLSSTKIYNNNNMYHIQDCEEWIGYNEGKSVLNQTGSRVF